MGRRGKVTPRNAAHNARRWPRPSHPGLCRRNRSSVRDAPGPRPGHTRLKDLLAEADKDPS